MVTGRARHQDSEESSIISFAGPVGPCSVNKAQILLLRRLREVGKVGSAVLLWKLPDVMEELLHLARQLVTSFHNVERETNLTMDALAKEGVKCDGLMINQSVYPFWWSFGWHYFCLVLLQKQSVYHSNAIWFLFNKISVTIKKTIKIAKMWKNYK